MSSNSCIYMNYGGRDHSHGRPKSVTAGLTCGLDCTLAHICDDIAAEAAYVEAVVVLYK